MRHRSWGFARALVIAAAVLGSPLAAAYSNLFVFGDSLSDTGNVFLATGGAVPAPPYYNGRFTNGPTWIDELASSLGMPAGAIPALAGGNNYAFGGARTGAGTSPVPGVLAQIGGLWAPAHPSADPGALYVMVGGGNDMRDARTAFPGNTAVDAAGRQAAAAAAMNNLISGLGFLASTGTKHVLVATMPDLGATPEAAMLGLQFASTDASQRFNALIPMLLAAGATLGVNMYLLDMADLLDDVRADAINNGGATYGITNVLTPCGSFPFSIGISCDVSLFSDALHPSAVAHALLGQAALEVVNGGVPEPATAWLVLLAMTGLALRRRMLAASPLR
jgi:outer membrane lipase/esterase